MDDITARTPRRGTSAAPGPHWLREWWLWPLALLTLGWALMLGAYAWNHEDEQRKRSSSGAARDLDPSMSFDRAAHGQPFPMRGRVLVEHGLVLRPAARDGAATVATTQWLFPVVDADWHDGQAVRHVLRVPEGASLRTLSQVPQGPWLVTPRGLAASALIEALRARGLQVDASTALVQWHSSLIEP